MERTRAIPRTMRFALAVVVALALSWLLPAAARATTYYVAPAPAGNDGNAGTMAAPFASFARAQTAAAAGDTVYFRAGTYLYDDNNSADAAGNSINVSKSGSSGKLINYVAFAGEVPIFNFSGVKAQVRIKGFNVTASFIHLKGFEITGVPQNTNLYHESWGIYNDGGTNNVYELLDIHHNMGPGLFITSGGNNQILNCDSHHNYDPNSATGPGTNADGFGCHVSSATDTGNVFRGCRSWWNSDDGWDFIQAKAPVTVDNCWSWRNGYLPDSTTISSGGDGNGFKGGGYGVPNTSAPANPPRHTIRFCLAFFNRANGFEANHHPIADYWYNNTAYENNASNFNMIGLLLGGTVGNVGVLRNNLSYVGALLNLSTDVNFNSWSLPVTVSDADFESVSPTGVDGPRQADGSLPNIPFMRLRADSDLIDKGTNVGLTFSGAAPDLGAFEAGSAASAGAGGGTASGGMTGAAGSDAGSGGGGAAGASGSDPTMGGSSPSGGASVAGSGEMAGAGAGGMTSAMSGGAGGAGATSSGGASPPPTSAGGAAVPGGSAGAAGANGGSGSGCSCNMVGLSGHPLRSALVLLAYVAALLRPRRRARRSSDVAKSVRW